MKKIIALLIAFAQPAMAAAPRVQPIRVTPTAPVRVAPAAPRLTGATLVPSASLAVAPKLGVGAAPVVAPVVELAPVASVAPVAAVAQLVQDQGRPVEDRPGLLGRLGELVFGKIDGGRAFDKASRGVAPGTVMGILPTKPQAGLPEGIVLDQAPEAPAPERVGGVSINAIGIPGVRGIGGIFEAGPIVLQADPTNEQSVEQALKALIDADPARYGVRSADLETVHVKRFEGVGNQADTVFAYFRQVKNGVPIHGSNLSFTVKVIQGRPILMAAMAQLYPNTPVETTPRFPDDQLVDRIWQRIGVPPNADGIEVTFLERKIIFSRGQWHTANLYLLSKDLADKGRMSVMVAVDVATGEAFAWDPRMGADASERSVRQSSGKISANVVEKGATKPNSKLIEVPLANLSVTVGNKTVTTDREGNLPISIDQETQISVKLDGLYATVNNRAGAPLTVTATLKPGEQAKLVFNKESTLDEKTIAQIQAYYLVNRSRDWLKDNQINDARIFKKLPINVNINDECNAYYTPGRPSENYFLGSPNCVNSAYDTVVMHEDGHYIDDMLGGIVNGGLSEGWGDIMSMYQLNNPIIGEGFLKNPRQGGVDYIRHGENTRQYNEYDEVHDQGEVWGGFGWKLRKMLIASLGEAGDAVARAIVLPTLYAKATNIPAAMAQVLVNDMAKDGTIPHEKEIRAAAKVHGVTLPENPSAIARFVGWLVRPAQWFSNRGAVAVTDKLTPRLRQSLSGAQNVDVSIASRDSVAVMVKLLASGAEAKYISASLVTARDLTPSQVRELAAMPEVRRVDIDA